MARAHAGPDGHARADHGPTGAKAGWNIQFIGYRYGGGFHHDIGKRADREHAVRHCRAGYHTGGPVFRQPGAVRAIRPDHAGRHAVLPVSGHRRGWECHPTRETDTDASVSIPATNSLQPTQDSSTGTDTVSASAPTEMDTLLASIGQQATAPVMSQGSAVSSPLSGRTSPAALSTSSSATTPVAVSAQPAQASDGTTTPQQSQTAGVSNITVETSARADSRDSLASLATSPDHTASAGYNAVTAPTDGAGIVAGTEHQGNGLSDHSGTSEGERGDDAQQQAGTASPASMTLSTDLSAPSAFTLEHAGQTTDTQSVQAQTQTDEEDEAGNQILSSPGISRSADGQTSVSMTIMTADSTPVHVRLEGTDGITTGIVLQSEDEATARHLATNRHELVTALGATGMEVGNLKIDVVAATDNGANLTDQAPVAMPGMMAALQGACPATGPDRMGGSHSRQCVGEWFCLPGPGGS